MTYTISPKIPNQFECADCHYITSNKKDFSKHLATDKHKKRTNTYKILTDTYANGDLSPNQYKCDCGKVYKHRQSLYTHRKKCDMKVEKNNEEKIKNNENNQIIEKTGEKK